MRGLEEGDGVGLGGRGVENITTRAGMENKGERRALSRRARNSQRSLNRLQEGSERLRGHPARRIVPGVSLEEPGCRDFLGLEEVLEVAALALDARTVQLEERPLSGNANNDVTVVVPERLVVSAAARVVGMVMCRSARPLARWTWYASHLALSMGEPPPTETSVSIAGSAGVQRDSISSRFLLGITLEGLLLARDTA